MKKVKGLIGIDEVGRGAFAGPVTVCATYIEDTKPILKEIFEGTIKDSKKLSKHNRFNIYQTIRNKRNLKIKVIYAITSRKAEDIDKKGLTKSIQECVDDCIKKLIKKGININNVEVRTDHGLKTSYICNQKSFIKGDEKFVEIALASIIAKVSRDQYMIKLSRQFPAYLWHENVGYGTQKHREVILEKGITKFHRKLFLKGFKLFENKESI